MWCVLTSRADVLWPILKGTSVVQLFVTMRNFDILNQSFPNQWKLLSGYLIKKVAEEVVMVVVAVIFVNLDTVGLLHAKIP